MSSSVWDCVKVQNGVFHCVARAMGVCHVCHWVCLAVGSQAVGNAVGAARCIRGYSITLVRAGQELPQTSPVLPRHRLHGEESGLCVQLASGRSRQERAGGETAPSIQELHRIQHSAQSD